MTDPGSEEARLRQIQALRKRRERCSRTMRELAKVMDVLLALPPIGETRTTLFGIDLPLATGHLEWVLEQKEKWLREQLRTDLFEEDAS